MIVEGRYDVYLRAWTSQPRTSLGLVVVREGQRWERARILRRDTYHALVAGVSWALERLDRPGCRVVLHVNNKALVAALTGTNAPTAYADEVKMLRDELVRRPGWVVEWLSNAQQHPEMERAQDVALAELLRYQEARR